MRHFISAVKIGFIQKELESHLFCINGLDTTIFIFILSLKGFGWGKGTSPTKKKRMGKENDNSSRELALHTRQKS